MTSREEQQTTSITVNIHLQPGPVAVRDYPQSLVPFVGISLSCVPDIAILVADLAALEDLAVAIAQAKAHLAAH